VAISNLENTIKKNTMKALSNVMTYIMLLSVGGCIIMGMFMVYGKWINNHANKEFCSFKANNSVYSVIVTGTETKQTVSQINTETGEEVRSWNFTDKEAACEYAYNVTVSIQDTNPDNKYQEPSANKLPYEPRSQGALINTDVGVLLETRSGNFVSVSPPEAQEAHASFGMCGEGDPELWFYDEYSKSRNKLSYKPQTQGALIDPDKNESTFRQSGGSSSRTW
jgi:hypothetical protein